MKKALPFLFGFSLLLLSCSPKFNPGAFEEPEDVFIGASDSTTFDLEMLFVAATHDYLILEARFINLSEDELTLEREDFELRVPERALKSSPYSTDELMEFLMLERKAARKARRNRNIINGLTLAGTLLTGFSGGGFYSLDIAFYSLQDVLYLTDDNRILNREIRNIEGEMDYLREVNLESEVVAPRDTIFREIFFPFDFTSEDVEVIYHRDSVNYSMILTPEDMRLR